MPSQNRRVNLTLTDEIYDQLQVFKKKNGIQSDATACLQLVVRQLKALETTEEMNRIIKGMTIEQLIELSNDGLKTYKDEVDKA